MLFNDIMLMIMHSSVTKLYGFDKAQIHQRIFILSICQGKMYSAVLKMMMNDNTYIIKLT